MTEDRHTLMISPVIPAMTGNGLAMRAAMTVRALARHGRLSLLVHQLYPSVQQIGLDPHLAALCEEVIAVPHGRRPAEPMSQPAGPFDAVHCFRLSTLPFARDWMDSRAEMHVDFDDLESRSHLRIADVLRLRGRTREASLEDGLAAKALTAEIDAIARFDRVYLAGEMDADHLPFCGRAAVGILPNVVDVPEAPENRNESSPFTFLFVGTHTYFPNEDGIRHFCDEVLPLVAQDARSAFRVRVVGLAPASVRELGRLPHVEITGSVSDLTPYYSTAGAVIVPVRCGGGTRIKLLEAFARGVPSVSTTIGAEGIGVRSGSECLIADDPRQFADACLTLMHDPVRAGSIARAAQRFVTEHHSLEVAVRAVAP